MGWGIKGRKREESTYKRGGYKMKNKEERLLIEPHLKTRTCQINETLCHG
jgi:hypothetical protein